MYCALGHIPSFTLKISAVWTTVSPMLGCTCLKVLCLFFPMIKLVSVFLSPVRALSTCTHHNWMWSPDKWYHFRNAPSLLALRISPFIKDTEIFLSGHICSENMKIMYLKLAYLRYIQLLWDSSYCSCHIVMVTSLLENLCAILFDELVLVFEKTTFNL